MIWLASYYSYGLRTYRRSLLSCMAAAKKHGFSTGEKELGSNTYIPTTRRAAVANQTCSRGLELAQLVRSNTRSRSAWLQLYCKKGN